MYTIKLDGIIIADAPGRLQAARYARILRLKMLTTFPRLTQKQRYMMGRRVRIEQVRPSP